MLNNEGARSHHPLCTLEEHMTSLRKLAYVACATLALMLPFAAHAQGKLEKPKVSIAVGGKSGFYYLPLTIAERLNYFKEEGLDVEISDFDGGSKALQAVVGEVAVRELAKWKACSVHVTRRRTVEAAHHRQERRLSAPRRTHD